MRTTTRKIEALLWTGQALLAALFTFAGVAKLVMPGDALAAQSGMPGTFLHFIAICELLGAAGLVLPGLLRVHTYLTPVAAVGLTVIMAGAVTTSAASAGVSAAVVPLIVGTITASIARSRGR
jgi:hypothetical protein